MNLFEEREVVMVAEDGFEVLDWSEFGAECQGAILVAGEEFGDVKIRISEECSVVDNASW